MTTQGESSRTGPTDPGGGRVDALVQRATDLLGRAVGLQVVVGLLFGGATWIVVDRWPPPFGAGVAVVAGFVIGVLPAVLLADVRRGLRRLPAAIDAMRDLASDPGQIADAADIAALRERYARRQLVRGMLGTARLAMRARAASGGATDELVSLPGRLMTAAVATALVGALAPAACAAALVALVR